MKAEEVETVKWKADDVMTVDQEMDFNPNQAPPFTALDHHNNEMRHGLVFMGHQEMMDLD